MATLLVAGGYLAYEKIQKSRSKRKARKASEAATLSEQEAQNAERFARLNGPLETSASSSGRLRAYTADDSNSNPTITIDGDRSRSLGGETMLSPTNGRPRGRQDRSQSASLPRTGRLGSHFREDGLVSPTEDRSSGRRSFDSRVGLVNSGSTRPVVQRQSSSYYGSDREESDDDEESRERVARQRLSREEPNLWAEPPPNYEELFGREGRKSTQGPPP